MPRGAGLAIPPQGWLLKLRVRRHPFPQECLYFSKLQQDRFSSLGDANSYALVWLGQHFTADVAAGATSGAPCDPPSGPGYRRGRHGAEILHSLVRRDVVAELAAGLTLAIAQRCTVRDGDDGRGDSDDGADDVDGAVAEDGTDGGNDADGAEREDGEEGPVGADGEDGSDKDDVEDGTDACEGDDGRDDSDDGAVDADGATGEDAVCSARLLIERTELMTKTTVKTKRTVVTEVIFKMERTETMISTEQTKMTRGGGAAAQKVTAKNNQSEDRLSGSD